MPYAHIAVFAFNRPLHLEKTLTALAANELAEESDVTVFCDGPRHEADKPLVDAVRQTAGAISGFRTVRCVSQTTNQGLARSIINGVTDILGRHNRVIVIEDDIITARHTLRFLNACLEEYEKFKSVHSISAYSPPFNKALIKDYPFDVYFSPVFSSWGWATWRDRWEDMDWSVADYNEYKSQRVLVNAFYRTRRDLPKMLDDQMSGKLNSWAVRAAYHCFKHGYYVLWPIHSYVTNIGMDGTGVHCSSVGHDCFANDLSLAKPAARLLKHVFLENRIVSLHETASTPFFPTLYRRVLRKSVKFASFFLPVRSWRHSLRSLVR